MEAVEQKKLNDFFSFKYDQLFSERIIQCGVNSDVVNDVMKYLEEIINIPLENFYRYVLEYVKKEGVLASDVFQFSKFYDGIISVPCLLKKINRGVGFYEIGKELQNDGKLRSDYAITKYGENHIKLAELLGLVHKEKKNVFYVSPFGTVISDLSTEMQNKILVRLIVRNKLVSQILIYASERRFKLETLLYELSTSTYNRRKGNVKCVLEVLGKSEEYDFSDILKNVQY